MIVARIVGAESVIANLGAISGRTMEALKADVSRLAITLLRKVKEEKLSGQVLKNQTGTLRRSINQQVESTPNSVTGRVGVNLSYAAAHEFGFKGAVTVRAHMRMVKQAFGKALKSPKKYPVGPFSRSMNLPERSFLRSALAEMAPEILQRIEAAVKKALRQ